MNLFALSHRPFKSFAPIFDSRAERKCFTIAAPNSLLEHNSSRNRIRYRNESWRDRRGQTVYRHHEEFFQAPYLDYVVRFVAAVKKTHETIRVSSFGIRSFDTTPGRCLAAACYIVALDIDHAEKLQRVKRNLRCWGCLKIDGTPWEVRPRSRIPVKLSPNSIVFFDIRIEYVFRQKYSGVRRNIIDYTRFIDQGGQTVTYCHLLKFDRSNKSFWNVRCLFCEK